MARVHIGDRSFEIPEGLSVLVGLERQGVRLVPVGCRGGGCGVCKVRVVEGAYRRGKMSKRHVSDAEAEAGWALACRVYPESDLVVEVAEQPAPA